MEGVKVWFLRCGFGEDYTVGVVITQGIDSEVCIPELGGNCLAGRTAGVRSQGSGVRGQGLVVGGQ